MWAQLVEARLENMSLKVHCLSEQMNDLKRTMEKSFSKIMLAMSEMKNEFLAVKRRQDLVFQKQDIIHSTLAGEIPSNTHSFWSPSVAPSVVAWSPTFPSRQHQPHHTFFSGYSSPLNVETISNEDIQSFLSLDLGTEKREKMRRTQADDPIDLFSEYPPLPPSDGTPVLPLLHGTGTPALQTVPTTGTPAAAFVPPTQLPTHIPVENQFVQAPPPAYNPLPLPPTYNPLPPVQQTPIPTETQLPSSHQTPPTTEYLSHLTTPPPAGIPPQSLPTSVGILLSELGLLLPSLSGQTRCSPSADEDTSQVSTAHSVSSMEELSRNNPIPRGDVAADVVINAFMLKNNNTLDVNNVGRLGVLLARYTFFGDELLQESSLKGKGKRPGLDPKVLDSLVATIHNRHPFSMMTLSDFRNKIRPKIERALTDFLKPKPKNRV